MHGVDTFRIMLDSENPLTQDETIGEYTFHIRLPFTRSDYKKYVLYVDNFSISLKGLTTQSVHVRLLNLSNYNSYSSQTGGNNNIIAYVYSPNMTADRTTDLVLNYQGSTAPYHVSSLPNNLAIKIAEMDNANINLSSANNFWTLNLRIDAYYEMSC